MPWRLYISWALAGFVLLPVIVVVVVHGFVCVRTTYHFLAENSSPFSISPSPPLLHASSRIHPRLRSYCLGGSLYVLDPAVWTAVWGSQESGGPLDH